MRLLLLLGSLAVTLLAQSPEAVQRQQVLDRFASTDPVDLAWGAQLAARYKLPEFIPQIEGLLARSEAPPQRAAMHALISLKATDAPPAPLIKLLPGNFNADMILLLWNPASPPNFLLDLMQQKLTDDQWLVVHSAALERRIQGQATALVRDWTFRFRVSVTDAGTPPRQQRKPSSVCAVFGSVGNRQYPQVSPVFIDQRRSFPLTTAGPHPLTYDYSDCFKDERVNRYMFTRDYLAYLADYRASLPSNEIRFISEEQFRRSANDLRGQLKQYTDDLRAALIAAGALTPGEWRDPKIEIEASDERDDRSIPLTGVDWFV